jgi:hypothetical protein
MGTQAPYGIRGAEVGFTLGWSCCGVHNERFAAGLV